MSNYVYFWGLKTAHAIYSNFYPTTFIMDGHKFSSSEQAFMWLKAVHFGDKKAQARLLIETDPPKCKAIGRSVANYDNNEWDSVRYAAMKKALHAKFTQNNDLLVSLLLTAGKTLVEASPSDPIWGIGLTEKAIIALGENEALWKGQNLLGKALVELRDEMQEKMASS